MLAAIERMTGVKWRGQGPAFLVGFGHAATHWIIGTFYVLLPYIAETLELSYAQTGGLVTVFHASAFIANVGSGAIVDIGGRRALVQGVSLVIGGGALMAVGLADSALLLASLVVLIGITNNLWHPAAISFLSRRYPGNRGYALALHTLGASLGDMVAPVVAGAAMVGLASWQGAISASAIPVFIIATLILIFLTRTEKAERSSAEPTLGGRDYLAGLGRLVRDRAVVGLCVMAGFRSMTQNGLLVFLPLLMVNELGFGPVIVGVALMSMQMGGMIAGPLAGTLSDRVGRQPVVFIFLTAATVVVAGLTFVEGATLFIGVLVILGFVLFAVRPVIHSWVMDLTPDEMSGSAISLLFGTQSGLSTVVPFAGGVIADIWGLESVFYMLAGTMVVANLIVYFLPDSRRSDG